MIDIETTPDTAALLYATMAQNLSVIRRRTDKPLTLADKVLLGHLDDPETQEIEPGRSQLSLRPDRVVFQDVLGQSGMLQFMQTRREQGGGAHHDPLRPSDPGAHRRRGGPARVARRKPRGVRLPALCRCQVRLRLLGTGRRHHPPGGAGELRVSRAH